MYTYITHNKDELEVIYFDKIGSTNKYALSHIDSLKDGQIIAAGIQTEGKGRLGRTWLSGEKDKNVFMTIVLKPDDIDLIKALLSNITQYVSVILCNICHKSGIPAVIKWPNDVLVNGKKISGILSESTFRGSKCKGIVIGIGINVNKTPDELASINQPATAFNIEIDRYVDPMIIMKELTAEFFRSLLSFYDNGFLFIYDEYTKYAFFLGKEVKVNQVNTTLTGIAEDITIEGALLLRDNQNKLHTIFIGDVLCG